MQLLQPFLTAVSVYMSSYGCLDNQYSFIIHVQASTDSFKGLFED